MYNISEIIETIGNIINELPEDAPWTAGFREQYKKILFRSKDPYFYLSTIGDFSSGKSTLINTILKRKLLKVAHLATTAVPTYIYLGKSDRVVIYATFEDGKTYNFNSEKDVKTFEKEFGIELPPEDDSKISLLTANEELSLKIKKVDIELPNDTIINNLCIIDTPGVNPGADFAEKHAEITTEILNEKADAIIILFPADQAYTQAFEKFLKDNAEYFMKEAVFVVTMMDRVDEEEREDVINFVKTNLRNNFHLSDPQVLSCSAMLSGKDPYWSDQFTAFEQSLMDRVTRNRQRIINDRLIKLSNELLEAIQSEILMQKEDLEKRLSVVRNHSVPNLISVLTDKKTASYKEFLKIQKAHHAAIKKESTTLERKIIQTVRSRLNACNSRSAVTKYVNDSLAKDIERSYGEIYATSAQYTKDLDKAVSSAVSEMVERMRIYYGEIGSVLKESTALATSKQHDFITNKLSGLDDMIGKYEGKLDIATAIGGAGLAAIIFAGLGPIGWILGGFAALIGGDKMFVDSSRNKVLESLSIKVPEISKSVVKELNNGMESNYKKATNTLNLKKDELVAQYKPIYEDLERRFMIEKLYLTLKIKYSDEIQNRIRSVLQQINEIQGELAE